MLTANLSRGWSVVKTKKYQRGQALIYGIFVMVSALSALFFLFNTGQLSREKTKLVDTADAVAYSAAVMHARALNFDAYNNRALVANEVIVAQMVSLSSWAQYADTHAQNLRIVFPACLNPYSAAASTLINYDPIYAVMCYATVTYLDTVISDIAQRVPTITNGMIGMVEANKAIIKAAEMVVHSPLFETARSQVMNDVAQRNYAGLGPIRVEAPGFLPASTASALTDDWRSFTRNYDGDDRARFAQVARAAAYSDDFVLRRSWTSNALLPNFSEWKCVARGRRNSVKRRGGTELIGLDEWKAEDTESFWRVHNAGRFWQIRCDDDETPIGYGVQEAYSTQQDSSGAFLGGSPSTNRWASASASSSAFTNYTGLPSFYDLSPALLSSAEPPRLRYAVRVVRDAAAIGTSGAASQIPASSHLNSYTNKPANGRLTAISTGEVYFERPLDSANIAAVKANSPSSHEMGSLFNPYWQVRLVANNAADVVIAAQP